MKKRSKIKLSYITDNAIRRTSFKKRKGSYCNKLNELTTLCGVEACAIIESEFDEEATIWPSVDGARKIIEKFRSIPEFERGKREKNQESLVRQMIEKTKEQLRRLRIENHCKEFTQVMYDSMKESFSDVPPMIEEDRVEFNRVVTQNIREIKRMIENRNEGSSSNPPNCGREGSSSSSNPLPKIGGVFNNITSLCVNSPPFNIDFPMPVIPSNAMNSPIPDMGFSFPSNGINSTMPDMGIFQPSNFPMSDMDFLIPSNGINSTMPNMAFSSPNNVVNYPMPDMGLFLPFNADNAPIPDMGFNNSPMPNMGIFLPSNADNAPMPDMGLINSPMPDMGLFSPSNGTNSSMPAMGFFPPSNVMNSMPGTDFFPIPNETNSPMPEMGSFPPPATALPLPDTDFFSPGMVFSPLPDMGNHPSPTDSFFSFDTPDPNLSGSHFDQNLFGPNNN